MINHSENDDEDEKQITQIEIVPGLDNSKYKDFLSMMMLICIKQYLNNICMSIHEKVKQH